MRIRPEHDSAGSIEQLERAIVVHAGGTAQGRRIARLVINVEMLLFLAVEIGDPHHADKAHLLLSNYRLLLPSSLDERGHLLQMARRHLMPIASGTSWNKRLAEYLEDCVSPYRQYDIVDNEITRRDAAFGGFDRAALYKASLLQPIEWRRSIAPAQSDKAYRYWVSPDQDEHAYEQRGYGFSRVISIPARALAWRAAAQRHPLSGTRAILEHKPTREAITVSLDELREAAREADERTGKAYRAAIIDKIAAQGLLKHVEAVQAHATDRLSIDCVTNLVGIVGAGKSVVSHALISVCAKRGLRVITIQNAISDVMETLSLFKALNIHAIPLVSKSNRLTHLDRLAAKGRGMLLDDAYAHYLETPCILDGFATDGAGPVPYGSIPCLDLKDEHGKRCSCPFIEICPSQAMAREALSAQVVITTPAGFAMITLGAERRPFFECALAGLDMVIFDEADRVQIQLDQLLAPTKRFQEFIRESAEHVAHAMRRPPQDKLSDIGQEYFYDLRGNTDPTAKALVSAARNPSIHTWRGIKDATFTSMSLHRLLTDEGLPPTLANDLETHIRLRGKPDAREDGETIGLGDVIHNSCESTDDGYFQGQLDRYLTAKRCEHLSPVLRDRFAFTLKVVRFDNFLHELEQASDMLAFKDNSVKELYGFLHASSSRQAPYLPASPVGNLCGLKIDGHNDIVLYRHFAIGRTLMTSLPWLDTMEDGSPAGPHALLLSGSSYEPGCLQYHITHPVDYLLEAPAWIAQTLSESTVRDLGIETFVSGSGTKQRSARLDKVLCATVDALTTRLDETHARKILVIVNNYDEASLARDVLTRELRRIGRTETVCALADNARENDDQSLPRSEVQRFDGHRARILVAPAMAIERGFNIVDADGHAVFGTLVFAVRPMGAPGDLGVRFRRLIGLVEQSLPTMDPASPTFEQSLRERAWMYWMQLERDEELRLSERASIRDRPTRDIIATLMVVLVQVFGRLARLKRPDLPAPHVYFADGAFAGGNDPEHKGFRTLDLLEEYMGDLIANSGQPAVAQALYGPFHTALKKGVRR